MKAERAAQRKLEDNSQLEALKRFAQRTAPNDESDEEDLQIEETGDVADLSPAEKKKRYLH